MRTDGSEDVALHMKKESDIYLFFSLFFFFHIHSSLSPRESLNESAQFRRKGYHVFYYTTSSV